MPGSDCQNIGPRHSIMRTFTRQELARFNGRDGNPAYVAYGGQIYDVSASYHWRGGTHWVLHEAGRDLTREMDQAPHTEALMARVPVIGILVD